MSLQVQSMFEDQAVEVPNDDRNEVSSEKQPFELNARNLCEALRLVCGTVVVTLLMIVLCIGVANRWCVLQLHPALLFAILFLCVILLAYVEALHYGCELSCPLSVLPMKS